MSESQTKARNQELGHAEQLLFSCVSSKVIFCHAVTCNISHFTFHMSHVICQMLMLIPGTFQTTFVFMSMLKSRLILCLKSLID